MHVVLQLIDDAICDLCWSKPNSLPIVVLHRNVYNSIMTSLATALVGIRPDPTSVTRLIMSNGITVELIRSTDIAETRILYFLADQNGIIDFNIENNATDKNTMP